jgi:hypothetical protein
MAKPQLALELSDAVLQDAPGREAHVVVAEASHQAGSDDY